MSIFNCKPVRAAAVILLAFSASTGCTSSHPVRSNIDSKKYQVVSDLYVYGARWGKPKPWFITTPGAFVTSKTLENEFKTGDSSKAEMNTWKIYSKLFPGDIIEIERSTWVNSTSYSGYEIWAKLSSGKYEGHRLKVRKLVMSPETSRSVEEWNIYKENHPRPDTWRLDSRYLIEVK